MHFTVQYQFDILRIAQKHNRFVAEKSSRDMPVNVAQSVRFFFDLYFDRINSARYPRDLYPFDFYSPWLFLPMAMCALPNNGIGSGPGIFKANWYASVLLKYRWTASRTRNTSSDVSANKSHVSKWLLATEIMIPLLFNWILPNQISHPHYTPAPHTPIIRFHRLPIDLFNSFDRVRVTKCSGRLNCMACIGTYLYIETFVVFHGKNSWFIVHKL